MLTKHSPIAAEDADEFADEFVDRVVVVGAGIAGIACARTLAAAGVPVTVLDRGRRIGGRMASRRMHGRVVDHGASYLTARTAAFDTVVQDWVRRGLARPWTDGFPVVSPAAASDEERDAGGGDSHGRGATGGQIRRGPIRYASPGGLRSLVEDLATGLDVRSAVTVSAVRLAPSPARPTIDDRPARAVVLAMPDPQAARLLAAGGGINADSGAAEALSVVRVRPWEPTIAVAAGWPRREWPFAHGAFISGSPVLGWVADDGSRRDDDAPVLVAHTVPDFARRHLDDPATAVPAVVAALRELFDLAEPLWTFAHRWTLAKPAEGRDQDHYLNGRTFGLCGDGWGMPRVETAWLSGNALGRAMAGALAGVAPD